MKIDSPKGRVLLQEAETIVCETLSDLVRILFLSRKRESGDHAGVLIEAGAFRKSAQSAFNGTNP